ncbi:MAG: hypothetical protein R3D71_08680 [Rickettsiales bacterium]
MEEERLQESVTGFINLSHNLIGMAHGLLSPSELPVLPTNDISVEAVRKNLRLVRNLPNLDYDMENWLRDGDIPDQLARACWLQDLINCYAGQVKIAYLSDPDKLNHYTIEHANHSIGSIAMSVAMHTQEMLPDEEEIIAEIDSLLDKSLMEWDYRMPQSIERLVDDIESGLYHLINRPLGDRSPVDKLIEVSNKIQETVRQIYTIDDLDEPAREESIELAREILDKLKNMVFSERDIEEAIDVGQPIEKLSFAKKLNEMVEMYRNLLTEAKSQDIAILKDSRILEATLAAVDCAHGISLMAMKEIPANSMEIQQISANLEDIKRKKLTGITLSHLMSQMESGVDKAAEQALKKRDKGKKIAEEARAQEEFLRHRRRRHLQLIIRHQIHRAHQAQLRERMMQNARRATEMNMRNQLKESTVSQSSEKSAGGGGKGGKNNRMVKLNKLDMDAIRKAGDSLRKSNKQAVDIMTMSNNVEKGASVVLGASDVEIGAKITADDKNFAEKEKEARNPSNPNHPRNRNRTF